MKILFHGNFESVHDWSFLGEDWRVFSLWDYLKNDFKSWQELSQQLVSELSQKKIEHVAGYSLGGRVLLTLLDAGLKAERVSFFSTHPGLPDDERTSRIWADLKWKERVLKSDWKALFEEWNHQDLFMSDPDEERDYAFFAELEKYRQEIAIAFDLLSLGRMRCFSDDSMPALSAAKATWICGENDLKFKALAEKMLLKNPMELIIVPGASHRIHLKDPFAVRELLNNP